MLFEIYQDKSADGLWRWRFKDADGAIVGTSGTGYRDKANCLRGIELMKKSSDADTVEKHEWTSKTSK